MTSVHINKQLLDAFSTASEKKYGSYAFSAGFLESMIATMLEEIPKRKKTMYIKQLEKTIAELEQHV